MLILRKQRVILSYSVSTSLHEFLFTHYSKLLQPPPDCRGVPSLLCIIKTGFVSAVIALGGVQREQELFSGLKLPAFIQAWEEQVERMSSSLLQDAGGDNRRCINRRRSPSLPHVVSTQIVTEQEKNRGTLVFNHSA